MIYALADGSNVVRLEHLKAALAVWDYCRESARELFPKEAVSVGDKPLDMFLFELIQKSPGIDRSAIRSRLGTKIKAHEINEALASLSNRGFAHMKRSGSGSFGGKPKECWYPGQGEQPPSPSRSKKENSTRSDSGEKEGNKPPPPEPEPESFIPSDHTEKEEEGCKHEELFDLVCGDDESEPVKSHVSIIPADTENIDDEVNVKPLVERGLL